MGFFRGIKKAMARVIGNERQFPLRTVYVILTMVVTFGPLASQAQSGSQPQAQPPSSSQPAQDIPDAPSAVQPPAPKPAPPPAVTTPDNEKNAEPAPVPSDSAQQPEPEQQTPPPPMPPVETVPAGTVPRNQINPTEDLYKLVVPVNFVQIPVMVKDP